MSPVRSGRRSITRLRDGDMDEFKELLGVKKEPLLIRFEAAREMLCRGLRYFVGEEAKWLPGYDDVAEWLSDNNRRGLLLYGANGRGKTLLCYKIIPTLMAYHYKAVMTFSCRGNALRNVTQGGEDYLNMMRSSVVFIDDFGTENLTSVYGERRDVFSEVVDWAEQECKILVLTSNLTPAEIQARYGLRTLDRLQAITRAICLTGESMRNNGVEYK